MSKLTEIQDELRRRFQRPQDEGKMPGVPSGALPQPINDPMGGTPLPRPVDAPSGGAALGTRPRSVFAPPPQPNGQVSPPADPSATTRQRSVFAPPPASEPANEGFGSSGEPFSSTRDRRAQPRDYIADDTQYLRDLNNQPRTWKDKGVDAIRALNSALGSNPKAFTPTARERQIGETEQRIGQGLEIAQKQAQISNAGMVPVQTADGRTIMIPRAKVGDWETHRRTADQNQQKIDATSRKPNYFTDAQGRRMKAIPQPDGPDKVETVSDVVRTIIPHTEFIDGRLMERDQETGRYSPAKDEKGNELTDVIKTPVTVVINGKKFRVSPNTAAMATATGERFNITEDRAERGETRQVEANLQNRTAKAADLVGQIEGARTAMATAKNKLRADPGDTKAQRDLDDAKAYGLKAAKELNDGYGDLYKAGEGSEGTPYYEAKGGGAQATGASGATGGSFNMKGWIADHPDASAAEKRAMRAKAKARNMAIVE